MTNKQLDQLVTEYRSGASPNLAAFLHLLIPKLNKEFQDSATVRELIYGYLKKNVKRRGSLEGFEAFWMKYNKKVGRAKAERAWLRLKPTEKEQISKTLDAFNALHKKDPKYKPHASTYLNAKRWEDDITSVNKSNERTWSL